MIVFAFETNILPRGVEGLDSRGNVGEVRFVCRLLGRSLSVD